VSDHEPPDSPPAFPPPREPDKPSPYRERIPPPVATEHAKPRVVATRPDPPGALGAAGLREGPTPVGLFDGRLHVLRALYTYLSNRPDLWVVLVLLFLGMVLSTCGRATFRSHYVD
jgi:hypothetical protein